MTPALPSPEPAPEPAPGTDPGPIRLGPRSHAALRPDARVTITGGFWADRRRVNAEVSIAGGPKRLAEAGNLENLRRAADRETGGFRGGFPFQDSDVYKWLEAAAWQLGDADAPNAPDAPDGPDAPSAADGPAGRLAETIAEIAALLARAQEDSGYLNTYYQVAKPDTPHYAELAHGHELYCAGHLIQAAVAHHRTTGRRDLLDVAVRFADHLADTFGPEGSGRPVDGIDGHPQVETALVELARETGQARYTELARYFVDRHGQHGGALSVTATRGAGRPGYYQDHTPLREATAVTGHAVRQLYLLAGAADIATETGDAELRTAVERLWAEMAARQTYLTGGVGAHHADEGFGHPYELPADRAYCETCAAIASVQFSWRMALLTGEARYSDLIERTLFNAVLCGVSLDGERYLYDNPLHVRDGHADQEGAAPPRVPWFDCACCPPNLMRLLASLPHYAAATAAGGTELQLHQYAAGTVTTELGGHRVELALDTDYPRRGQVTVRVVAAGDGPWTLALRVPHWSEDGWSIWLPVKDAPYEYADGWLRLTRSWTAGESLTLSLDMTPRLTLADPRVDAVRGCVAIERGPLVHCVEAADLPPLPEGAGLDDLELDLTAQPRAVERPDLLGGVTAVMARAYVRTRPEPTPGAPWWPYRPTTAGLPPLAEEPVVLTTVPYHAWANRAPGPMRVWLPATAGR